VTSNYEAICEENRRRYGTEIGRIGPMLLADRYDDRTHFIFELLQNAEDALSRRGDRHGPRKVTFELTPTCLTLSHFGRPFDEADVRGVCGIAESTKDKFSIGRFGIGFKSVYTFTDRPEIHSGDEDFAIENYVQPKRADRTTRTTAETQIVLPLKADDDTARQEITAGFRHLGPGALLFLRNIDEINWNVQDGASGVYLRSAPASLGPNVDRITVIGQETGKPEVDQNWLVFHHDVFSAQQERVGRVEVAFSVRAVTDTPGRWSVQPVATSPLVVFFPTVVSTHLGFLVQGPYRTTPSRDNIPRGELWNQHLVKETAGLLVDAMRWMRDNAMLDTSTLRCLPLDRKKFPEGEMFAPIFEAVRQAFLNEPLLPRFDGGFVPASHAKLARTQELRELFRPEQIAVLFGSRASAWLTGDITPDREPEIRAYLMQELDITEATAAMLVPRLTKAFLEAQSDEWMLRLYEFLSGQEAALRRRLDTIPLIRLEDGTHVVAHENGVAKAFLPSAIKTGFPTIRRAACETTEALSFLRSLGISEPDTVDDVIVNVLPKYRQGKISLNDYDSDIERIRQAFGTDSAAQREKLRLALRDTKFVVVADTGDGKRYIAKPGRIYIATDRLQELFAGVPSVMIVDNEYECLRGEDIRDMLVSCGASRYLFPQATSLEMEYCEKAKIRKEAGLERASWDSPPEDFTLRGLNEFLDFLPKLEAKEAAVRAKVLWEALADLESRGTAAFYGSYKWGYSHETRAARFDAAFIRKLNQTAWVPDADGDLVSPRLVMFDSLGWKTNPFLLSKIAFKPPIIDQLAKEAGIDPAALDLLRKLGITSVEDLTSRLGVIDASPEYEGATDASGSDKAPPVEETDDTQSADDDVYGDAKDLYGDDMPDIPRGTPDPDGGDVATSGTGRGSGMGMSRGDGQGNGGAHGGSGNHIGAGSKGDETNSGGQGKRSPGSAGGRPFISYLGAHPAEEEPDPDGLDQATRMKIEDQATTLIISLEPRLQRTPVGNPGFDLLEVDVNGQPVRWIEVKSMTGSLENRPVGLSRTQFEYARAKGDAFWLYIVEHATDAKKARILRIQNPVAHARTFSFDRGWSQIARTEPPTSSRSII
jgi:hypothetical protein